MLLFFNPNELNDPSKAVLASTLWIAIWWITEALPIMVTALLPIVLFPLTGGMDLAVTSAAYGHKFIFLIMGGFIIAIAIEKWNLHKRIALNIINFIGTDIRKIIWGFMLATAFLSMWISNTAATAMMIPIMEAVLEELELIGSTKKVRPLLAMSVAMAANIGGTGTIIGTGPNLLVLGVLDENFEDHPLTFGSWMAFAIPIEITSLLILWL